MMYLRKVQERLHEIETQHRYRPLPQREPSGIDFSSNDYLALTRESQVVEALRRAHQAGSGGARLLGGASREHALLEQDIAEWLGRERALLFTSGYHAAIGAIPVLASCVEEVYSDAYNHASLIDGIRLARTPCTVYQHGAALPLSPQRRPTLLVTESLFSMDADTVDLSNYTDSLGEHDVLLVDEAHALGVYGEQGAGLAHQIKDPRVVILGTLSKALGGLGGFIAGPAPLIELLVNAARSFIFDTALPPALALAGRIAILLAKRADDRRARLHALATQLRGGLREIADSSLLILGGDDCPIVPIVFGEEPAALRVAAALREKHIVAPAIRPPTVAPGTSRLRVSLRCDHTPEQVDSLVHELAHVLSITVR